MTKILDMSTSNSPGLERGGSKDPLNKMFSMLWIEITVHF